MSLRVISLTDRFGKFLPEFSRFLPSTEQVHRLLRPTLPPARQYLNRMEQICSSGPAHLVACVPSESLIIDSSSSSSCSSPSPVFGLCLYRLYPSSMHGQCFHVDDLIAHPEYRQRKVGQSLLHFCRSQASKLGCLTMTLEAETQQTDAHQFYYKQGLYIDSLGFTCSDFDSPPNEPVQLPPNISIHRFTTADGSIKPEFHHILPLLEPVHRQLRPQLPDGIKYIESLENILRLGPAHLYVALRTPLTRPSVFGLCVTRHYHNTAHGLRFHIDDLIIDERRRALGLGRALIQACKQAAADIGAQKMTVESGIQRAAGHKFYHLQKLRVQDFSFCTIIKSQIPSLEAINQH
jgi:GNAT superfamily N-acetyltransferase